MTKNYRVCTAAFWLAVFMALSITSIVIDNGLLFGLGIIGMIVTLSFLASEVI